MKTDNDRLYEDGIPLKRDIFKQQVGMIFAYIHDNMHVQTYINKSSIFWKFALSTFF